MAEEKLVMVDKERLAQLRANHREAVNACQTSDSLHAAWVLLGVHAALFDTLLSMMIDGEEQT